MKRLLMLLLALMLCVPAAAAESPVFYIEGRNADRVHLRAEPFISSDSLGLYYTGTDVIVIEYQGDWAWVMVGDEDGYIMREYLTLEYTSRQGPSMIVDNPDSTWVNLRMSPSMQGMVVMRPENGTLVQVLGETKDGWSYVDCDGVKGYILTSLLVEASKLDSQYPYTTVLASDGAGSYRTIHQYTAPNGQDIYFTAQTTQPIISFDDVNFDHWDDIVIQLNRGSSNAYYTFFVYDECADAYYRVDCEHTDTGLANYALYPELGIVMAYSNNGSAGADHEYVLYTWEDGWLKHLRSAVSFSPSDYGTVPGGTMVTTWHDRLHIIVRDYSGEETVVLFDETISRNDAEYRDVFNEETEALWQGLR